MTKRINLIFLTTVISISSIAQDLSLKDTYDRIIIEDFVAAQYIYNQSVLRFEGFNICSKMPFRIVKKEFISEIVINDSTRYELRKIVVNYGLQEFNDLIKKDDTVQVNYYILKGSIDLIKLFGFISSDLCKLYPNSNFDALTIVANELERKKILTPEEATKWCVDLKNTGKYSEVINKPSNILALFYGNSKESIPIFVSCKPLKRNLINLSFRCND